MYDEESPTIIAGTDPLAILDAAVDEATRRGYPATGWFLCKDEGGYSAWVYAADEYAGLERPLWTSANLSETLAEAAADCYTRASGLAWVEAEAEA